MGKQVQREDGKWIIVVILALLSARSDVGIVIAVVYELFIAVT